MTPKLLINSLHKQSIGLSFFIEGQSRDYKVINLRPAAAATLTYMTLYADQPSTSPVIVFVNDKRQ